MLNKAKFRTRFDKEDCIDRIKSNKDFNITCVKDNYLLYSAIKNKYQFLPPIFIFTFEQHKNYSLIQGKYLLNPVPLIFISIWFLILLIFSIMLLDAASDSQFFPALFFIFLFVGAAFFVISKWNKISYKTISKFLLNSINAKPVKESNT